MYCREIDAHTMSTVTQIHPKPLSIGPIRLEMPVVQAALSGYSDAAMRRIARRMGAPYTLCEVLLEKFVLTKGKKTQRLMRLSEEEHPVGGQLMGSDPEAFGLAAKKLVEHGFDVIDINFGCPVKKVLGRCRGGYHLSQPEVALEIVQRVREAVPPQIPVSVKMRRGIDDSEASREKFFSIFAGAFDSGVAAITVHGRTVEQRYIGPSRWEFLKELKQTFPDKTILGSGDLFSAQDCLDMMKFTGVDGVTAARGAIGYPWIFRDAAALLRGEPLPAPPSVLEQGEVIAEHYRLAEEVYPPQVSGRIMRKFGIKYAQLHPQTKQVRDAFIAVKNPGQWQQVLAEWYGSDAPGLRPRGPDDASACESECG